MNQCTRIEICMLWQQTEIDSKHDLKTVPLRMTDERGAGKKGRARPFK